MRRVLAALATLFLLQLQPQASAAVVVVHQVIDARDVEPYKNIEPPHAPFTLAEGDTLKMRFDFLPGQALQVVDLTYLVLVVTADDFGHHFVTTVNELTLFGVHGLAHDPAPFSTTLMGLGLVSEFIGEWILDNPPHGLMSFTGVEFTIRVDDFWDSFTERTYVLSTLFVVGTSTQAIAEPSSMSLALLALGAGALLLRRARGRAAVSTPSQSLEASISHPDIRTAWTA